MAQTRTENNNKKLDKKHCLLTEENLDETGATLKDTPQKSDVSKSSAANFTKLLKFRPCKATVVHALQPCDPASMVFCNWLCSQLMTMTLAHI
jgi:hypothetical protein